MQVPLSPALGAGKPKVCAVCLSGLTVPFPASAGSGNCPTVIPSSDRSQPAFIKGKLISWDVREDFCSCCQRGVVPCSWTILHLSTAVLLMSLGLCFALGRWDSCILAQGPAKSWLEGTKLKRQLFGTSTAIPPTPCAAIILSFI